MGAKIIAISNQKGGVGKTTSTISLGIGLVRQGKKVLLIDLDAQSNLTMSLGFANPDELDATIFEILQAQILDQPLPDRNEFLRTVEGVDFIPSKIHLASLETSLINVMSRENQLKQFLDTLKCHYDYILIDCMPSLGMLTINALTAADSVIIPVQAHYLAVKGLELLIQTISKVKRGLNPKLMIDGILVTMLDKRTKFSKEIVSVVDQAYGSQVRIFASQIPVSIKAAETAAEGKSIFEFAGNNSVAQAYEQMVMEILADE